MFVARLEDGIDIPIVAVLVVLACPFIGILLGDAIRIEQITQPHQVLVTAALLEDNVFFGEFLLSSSDCLFQQFLHLGLFLPFGFDMVKIEGKGPCLWIEERLRVVCHPAQLRASSAFRVRLNMKQSSEVSVHIVERILIEHFLFLMIQ